MLKKLKFYKTLNVKQKKINVIYWHIIYFANLEIGYLIKQKMTAQNFLLLN